MATPKIILPPAAVESYVAGASLAEVCATYGVSQHVVDRHLREAGVAPRRAVRRPSIVTDAIVEQYVAGESANALAARNSMAVPTIQRELRRRGIPIRGFVAQANLPTTRERTARTRQERMTCSSHYEDELATILDQIGEAYVRQAAIGPYNADFLLPDRHLVLEVLGGWDSRTRREQNAKRRRIFEARGYQYAEIAPPFDHLLHFGHPAPLSLVDRRTA